MGFIDFEKISRPSEHSMQSLHSHDHYELYFLLEGERKFFVKNKMFVVSKNTLVIIPPFSMHKTEGGPYKRININISPEFLTQNQKDLLQSLSEKTALKINTEYILLIEKLLDSGENYPVNTKLRTDTLIAITQTVIGLLSLQDSVMIDNSGAIVGPTNVSPEILKIIYYINQNYTKQITLKELCKEFYICKVSLCKKFKEAMHCSIMQYVMQLRVNKAKILLQKGDENIEEIANLCGFSSGNYFGLIFKRAVGISPLNYKKTR